MPSLTGTDITFAAQLLRQGRLVSIPTETVYGLAANALDPLAVAKIFEAKQRPHFDPLICHIAGLDLLEKYAAEVPDVAYKLADSFWPGPLTLVLPKKSMIPDITTSGHDTVGLRMPAHVLTLELLRLLDFPLAAPSANPFGYVSPTRAEHVREQLGDKIDFILDGGPCKVGIESTIIGFGPDNEVYIYRQGGIGVEEIKKIAPEITFKLNQSSNPLAPGQLSHHYATRTVIQTGDIPMLLNENAGRKVGVISFFRPYSGTGIARNWVLSMNKDLPEAASNLFHAMREADTANLDVLIAEVFPEEGIGAAINDRLRRAAAK